MTNPIVDNNSNVSIDDNSKKEIIEFSTIKGITNQIVGKTLEQLAEDGVFVFPELIKDAEDIKKDQMILQRVNDTYKTGNVMGYIGYGKERLTIKSRFSDESNDFFLQYMLEQVLHIPNILSDEIDTNQDHRIIDLLIFLFPYYLREALRKGIFKTYVLNNYNDYNVKGVIDIARHIKENTPFLGKVAYNQREFLFDNYLIELIRHVIEFIKIKPYGNSLLETVHDEVFSIVEVTNNYEIHDRRKVMDVNKKNIVRHAYYYEYRLLQRLCIMILQYEKHQIGSGIKRIHGILFDGAWLWEEYMNTLIGKRFHHPMNTTGIGRQYLFTSYKGVTGEVYPDFISENTENRIIVDAKYKRINNISGKDYLQVLAYMLRFGARQGFYLYPEESNMDTENQENKKLTNVIEKYSLNKGATFDDAKVTPGGEYFVTKLGLRIPQNAESPDCFIESIKNREAEIVYALEQAEKNNAHDS